MILKRVKILDIPIDNLDLSQAIEIITEFIKDGKTHLVVTPNSEIVNKACFDKKLKQILSRADLSIPDGIGLVWAARWLSIPLKGRTSGIDLLEKIFEYSILKNWQIYLLGTKSDIIKKLKMKLEKKYSGIKIVGIHSGYFTEEEEENIISEINKSNAKILLVGMGSPCQEKWLYDNLSKLCIPVCMGIGGSFDVLSGNISRASLKIRQWGFEWLYRLIREPWRIKRQAGLIAFMFKIFKKKMKKMPTRNKKNALWNYF